MARVRRNYFVKRWIREALSSTNGPVTARATLDRIKTINASKDTSRKSPNLSAVKLGAIMSRMPDEIGSKPGPTSGSPNLYWLKGR